jgi:hypothetical protein
MKDLNAANTPSAGVPNPDSGWRQNTRFAVLLVVASVVMVGEAAALTGRPGSVGLRLMFEVAFIGLIIWALIDIVRNRDLRRWTKVICAAFALLVPWIGVLMYIVVRHSARSSRRSQEQEADTSIRFQ